MPTCSWVLSRNLRLSLKSMVVCGLASNFDCASAAYPFSSLTRILADTGNKSYISYNKEFCINIG